MGLRSKHFTKQFFERHFAEELKKNEIDLQNGYPDTGNGLYSMKLPHAAWKEINNQQRTHLNLLEQHAPLCFFMLIAGLSFTKLTVILQIWHIIGRFMYNIGYRWKGPNGRILGVFIFTLPSAIGLLGLAFASGWNLGGGVDGFISFAVGK